MAFSPASGLVYVPAIELEVTYIDKGITRANWKRRPGLALDYGVGSAIGVPAGSGDSQSALVAWNLVTQKQAWRIPTPSYYNGGSWRQRGTSSSRARSTANSTLAMQNPASWSGASTLAHR